MSQCLCISLLKLTSLVFFHVKALVAQSCPTLCHPVDFSSPGSSVHGIPQARTLEWVAISFSTGSSRPKDRTWVSYIAGGFFTVWPTREALMTLVNLHYLLKGPISKYNHTGGSGLWLWISKDTIQSVILLFWFSREARNPFKMGTVLVCNFWPLLHLSEDDRQAQGLGLLALLLV